MVSPCKGKLVKRMLEKLCEKPATLMQAKKRKSPGAFLFFISHAINWFSQFTG